MAEHKLFSIMILAFHYCHPFHYYYALTLLPPLPLLLPIYTTATPSTTTTSFHYAMLFQYCHIFHYCHLFPLLQPPFHLNGLYIGLLVRHLWDFTKPTPLVAFTGLVTTRYYPRLNPKWDVMEIKFEAEEAWSVLS